MTHGSGLACLSWLTSMVPICVAPGSRPRSYPVRECLLVVLNEEWEHRLYAERDLAALEARGR